MANQSDYAYWRRELKNPGGPDARDTAEPVAGFWRYLGAKTKTDWPVAIWYDHEGVASHRVGNSTKDGADELTAFMGESTWVKCIAVTQEEYNQAMTSGVWSDGKQARNMSAAEKLDIIPDTPAEEGGNMELDEDGNPVDPFWLQIKIKLGNAQKAIEALGKIDTEDKANKVAAQIDILTEAGKLGEARRKIEKAPHDAAAAAVQTKWVPVLQPASLAIKDSKDAIDAFQKAERARLQRIADEEARQERLRLQAIADEEARVERVRLQAIADENARVERLRRQAIADENARLERERLQAIADAEAAAAGEAAKVVEVEAEVIEVVAEEVFVEAKEVVVEAAVVEKPKVSSAYGRAVSKAVVRKGRIVDEAKFIRAIKDGQDFKDWLQDKADKLARAKTEIKGMEIYEQ